MPITKKRFKWIIMILILIVMTGLAVIRLRAGLVRQDKWEAFRPSLMHNEIIIDGVVEDASAFLITGKSGASSYGDTLAVFKKEDGKGWMRIYENDFKGLKPWKLELADIDGDGKQELLTAVHKTALFDKTQKNRLFIFRYDKGKLVKKWTGSEIAGEWSDFMAGDFMPAKGDELIFIQKIGKGERVSVYYWFGFGFLLFAESRDYPDILSVSVQDDSLTVTCRERGRKRTVELRAENNQLTEAAEE